MKELLYKCYLMVQSGSTIFNSNKLSQQNTFSASQNHLLYNLCLLLHNTFMPKLLYQIILDLLLKHSKAT